MHVHPTAANCCRNLEYAPGVAPGSMEYGTDTTRAIIGVAFSGDARRYPNVRWIWSHAGGTAPFLAGRIEGASRGAGDRLPDGFTAAIKRFYYDLAGATNKGAVASLLQLVTPSQVLFGTDFPPGGTAAAYAKALASLGMFSAAEMRAIERENAVRLLPRLGLNGLRAPGSRPRAPGLRMLIPSIDLQDGSVVQLVQGEKLAIKADDAEPWIQKFSRFPRVQLIDLDAAMGKGDNAAIVADICGRLPCRVGGGIRSVARARSVLDAGAHAVIASSALFRDGAVDTAFRGRAG